MRRQSDRCPLLRAFEATAREHPDATAMIGPDRTASYAQLAQETARWAQRLGGSANAAGGIAMVVSDGGADLPAAFLGARSAGLVPLLVDALLPRQRRLAMREAAQPAVVVDLADGLVTPGSPEPRVLSPAAGYVVFTSGSQGPPKGIVGNAEGLLRFLRWEAATLRINRQQRVAMLTSPSFDVVLREMFLPLLTGGELQVAGPVVRADRAAVLPWLSNRRIEIVHLVPSLSAHWVAAAPGHRLPELHWSVFAGEPLHARHVSHWRNIAPTTRVGNLYGPSETTLAKFWHEVASVPPDGLQPVGRPLPDTRLRRLPLSLDNDQLCPGFRIGIESPDGSLGYLNGTVHEAEEQALTRSDGLTSFVTQDRGTLSPTGELIVEGRLDTLVKRRGVLVDTASIVAHALAAPGVAAACCLQVDIDRTGDLVLVVETGEGVDPRLLRNRLSRELGTAAPDRVVQLDLLPLLPNGKVDPGRVGDLLAAGTPMTGRENSRWT
jgi:non-ribosomal peptide synthetase component F